MSHLDSVSSPKTPDFSALKSWIPPERLITDPGEVSVYECDGLPLHKKSPIAVVLCKSEEEVVQTVKWCDREGLPFVPRGAGTGLSGGATPITAGVIIDLNRMNRIKHIDAENRFAIVEPGVINNHLSDATRPQGLEYAPDPSSQRACTIGGNVAENSGGPHCLKYGVTTDHVLGLRVVLPDGQIVQMGGPEIDQPGYDLTGLFVGTEGTFGIVTEVTVNLIPPPPSVRTYLAIFDSLGLACRMVSQITRSGILPAALEIMDQNTIRAVEASVFRAGYPEDAAAVLLIETHGIDDSLADEEARIIEFAQECHAIEFRTANDEKERMDLWKGRKGAFGAMGRVNTDLYVLDGVVPRTQLESVLNRVGEIAEKHQVTVSNVFHAGDGNLHPNISYDGRDPEESHRVLEAGKEILQLCVDSGGTISGEHGIGLEKSEFLPMVFSDEHIDTMIELRLAVDPQERSNPQKIFPDNRVSKDGGRQKLNKVPQ